MTITSARPRRMWGVNDDRGGDLYVPLVCNIDKITDETPDTKTFKLSFVDKDDAKDFTWEPGQFLEVTVFGAGEAPIGFASDPADRSSFELTVVERGTVTRAMQQLRVGDRVGVRGPLGNCWPLESIKGMDVIIVSGGCGSAPLRPAVLQMLGNRKDYGDIWVLYGARTPADRVFKYDLEAWSKRDDMHLLQIVDMGDADWKGDVGVVTELFKKVEFNLDNAVALTCGPPVMIQFATRELTGKGFSEDRIVTSLERYMKCGVGKCGHCCVDHVYICTEGPVFTMKEMRGIPEMGCNC